MNGGRNMKDRIEKAFDVLVGYCEKRYACENGCRFYVDGICIFQEETPPIDWKRLRKSVKHGD